MKGQKNKERKKECKERRSEGLKSASEGRHKEKRLSSEGERKEERVEGNTAAAPFVSVMNTPETRGSVRQTPCFVLSFLLFLGGGGVGKMFSLYASICR